MSTSSNDDTQSGGVNIDGGTVGTDGGDLVGRNKFSGNNMFVPESDKSREKLVDLLRIELEQKKGK